MCSITVGDSDLLFNQCAWQDEPFYLMNKPVGSVGSTNNVSSRFKTDQNLLLHFNMLTYPAAAASLTGSVD